MENQGIVRLTTDQSEPVRKDSMGGSLALSSDWISTKGVVITPNYLVDLMVEGAVRARLGKLHGQRSEALKQLTWLDPAVGDGAFVLGILRFYRRTLGPGPAGDWLPEIVGYDISNEAVAAANIVVGAQLTSEGIDPSSPEVRSRIQIESADSLDLFGDQTRVGSSSRTYDVVIGNPPYVRYQQMSATQRSSAHGNFPGMFSGSADYFTYFFAAALNARAKDGVISFVTPASFTRNSAGRNVRLRILDEAAVVAFLDLDELQVFVDVAVHCAVTILGPKGPDRQVWFKHFQTLSAVEEFSFFHGSTHRRRLSINVSGGWVFESEVCAGRHNRWSGPSLTDVGVGVRSGIRSGAASVFLLSESMVRTLPVDIRNHWTRKVTIPTKIERWTTENFGTLLWVPTELVHLPAPVMTHLLQHRSFLERRPEVENGKTPWFALRPCGYYDVLEAASIVAPDIARAPRFSSKPAGVLVSDGCIAIGSADDAVLAILNSSVALEYFRANCASVGSVESRGRLRMKASVLRDFPLPRAWSDEAAELQELRTLVPQIKSRRDTSVEAEINDIVVRFYERAG